VQRKFLKYAAFILGIDCPLRVHDYFLVLQKFNLSTLTDKRKKVHLNFLSKLNDGSLGTPELLQTVNYQIPVFNFNSVYPLFIPFCSPSIMNNRPLFRMMKLANKDFSFFIKFYLFCVYLIIIVQPKIYPLGKFFEKFFFMYMLFVYKWSF